MDALENQLKEARFLAEEADKKYDEVLRKEAKITWLCPLSWLLCALRNSDDCVDDESEKSFSKSKSLNIFYITNMCK